MLFSRREAEPLVARVRAALWPRRSWGRSLRYARLRLGRLRASPHAVGLGLAVGVFAAFQPYLGFQMLFAGSVAWLLRASVGAALIGTFVGGPLTWPIMWFASYHVGAAIVGETHAVTAEELWFAWRGLGALANPDVSEGAADSLVRELLYPLAVGSVPLGLLAGAAFYVMVVRAASLARRRAGLL